MKPVLRAAIIAAAMSATVAPSSGQSAAQDPQGAAMQLIRTSRALHDRAIETSDPVLMLAAARLRKDAGMTRGQVGVPDEAGTRAGTLDADTSGWESWLETAVRMAGGSDAIAGLAEDIRLSKSKGLMDQAVYTEARLPARATHRYSELNFVGGEYAEIRSVGVGNADIDMFVRDGRGAIVCSQTDPSNINQCAWTPDATGPFQVTLENKSDFDDSYALTTN